MLQDYATDVFVTLRTAADIPSLSSPFLKRLPRIQYSNIYTFDSNLYIMSRDSSVGKAAGYVLDGRVSISGRRREFFSLQRQ